MAEIYYLLRKIFTDRADSRLYQDIEKIPLSPNSAQRIDRRKVASDQLKGKLRTAFKAGSLRSEGPTQRRVTFQTPPTKRTPSETRPTSRLRERPRLGRVGDVTVLDYSYLALISIEKAQVVDGVECRCILRALCFLLSL